MADNPFVAEGLACASCAFYDGARACEVVSGDIAPDALCKLWIIPSDLIGVRAADDTAESSQVANHDEVAFLKRQLVLRTRKP